MKEETVASKKISTNVLKKIASRSASTKKIEHAGLAFDGTHYVMIVKAKRGELWNCGHLKDTTKPSITPLFEIAEKEGVPYEEQCDSICASVACEWGVLPHFLDVRYVGKDLNPSSLAVKKLFASARKQKLQSVPVTSLFFSAKFQTAIKNIAADDGRGAMLRLTVDDFTNPEDLAALIDGLMATLDLPTSDIDLLIDYGYRSSESEVIQFCGLHLALLPHINDWRTLSIASASFPSSISTMPMNVWHSQPRVDWLAWLAIRGQRATKHLRVPTFADYGIRGISTGVAIQNTPAPNLRYTSDQICLVRRGKKNQQQMKQIAQQLVARPEFMGPEFSFGDERIEARANDDSRSDGAAEHWILWCMNHHAEFVTQQLSTLP